MRITGGNLKGRRLSTTEGPGYRPATGRVREALFSMLTARGVRWPETRVLDLYAGSGALAFEALSRGAKYAVAVENDRKAAELIRKNAEHFGLPPGRLQVEVKDCLRFLAGRTETFDLIFIDPPYGQGLLQRTLRPLMRGGWLVAGGMLVAEVEIRLPVPLEPLNDLGLVNLVDREFGQTRILLWKNSPAPRPSTPEPSTP